MTAISMPPQPEMNPWVALDGSSVESAALPLDNTVSDNGYMPGMNFLEAVFADEAAFEEDERAAAMELQDMHAVTGDKDPGGIRRWLNAAMRAGQIAVATTVVSPANEVIRAGLVSSGYAHSHDPAISALTTGGSTMILETAGALAAAGLITTETGGRFFKMLNRKMKKVKTEGLSPVTKVLTTFWLGSVVGMSIEQAANPKRTERQNRRYGLLTSAWLAGSLAVIGAAGSEGLNEIIERPQIALPVAGGIAAVAEIGRRVRKKIGHKQSMETEPVFENWADSDENCDYRLTRDEDELRAAAELEQHVWNLKAYGDLEEEGYTNYIDKSRTFVAFDRESGRCVGVNRMFGGTEGLLPPFLDMPFDDEGAKAALVEQAKSGNLEELGTVAVDPEFWTKRVNLHLWRQALHDSRARGVTDWGIIMEPRRVKAMNRRYGFTFEQLGPVIDYQGGDCAAFVMNIWDGLEPMHKNKPERYKWFTEEPLQPEYAPEPVELQDEHELTSV